MTVVDVDEATEGVVAVVDFFAIGQGFHQQPTSSIALILSDQFAAIVAELGFLQQLPVEVILVSRATTVETGFLLDQAVGVIVEVVMLAALVFDFSQQQARVVIAIAKLAAVGIDAAANQMQFVGVLVAGDATKLVAFGGDSAIPGVGERASGAAGQGNLFFPKLICPQTLFF